MNSCHLLLVGLLMAACLVSLSSAALVIEEVLAKLEAYALAATTSTTVSGAGLTGAELVSMLNEWNRLPEETKLKALEVPQYRLLYHFGIVPSERIRDSLESDAIMSVAHVRRLADAYRRFRPGYLGQPIENNQRGRMHMKKLRSLVEKLKQNQPVELADFKMARTERDSWVSRYEDIFELEDVYANQDEMRNILNYHNSELAKPLINHVLPLLDKTSDPNVLKQVYYDKLWEDSKIRLVEGLKCYPYEAML